MREFAHRIRERDVLAISVLLIPKYILAMTLLLHNGRGKTVEPRRKSGNREGRIVLMVELFCVEAGHGWLWQWTSPCFGALSSEGWRLNDLPQHPYPPPLWTRLYAVHEFKKRFYEVNLLEAVTTLVTLQMHFQDLKKTSIPLLRHWFTFGAQSLLSSHIYEMRVVL